jgi:Txe/YoeB family toxin of Txe-Axe toxin-antitoxin module
MAKELNTSQPAISRTAKRDDVRELIKKEEAKLFEQIKKILEEIQNDPIFLAKYQKKLEKELLNFKWLS